MNKFVSKELVFCAALIALAMLTSFIKFAALPYVDYPLAFGTEND